ncbi:divalent-cation tolerance protein CutA [Asanoa iriomotensis]|uniref:Divalent-cation tolerance protein CutA n=1 Tax=Asanoa iriomotensis TaxID=234613 RepID=A0ABQ4C5J8_9ACTN|nr:divalent-cation tolerance protein CutA [Asanoa iriomotensis]GIF58053.1 divalent-cation tolerance protein CutA [Asanoa iriomotensis]
MPEQVCEVVITAPDPNWLASFARELVDLRLCAGGHTINEISSVFRWRGEVNEVQEARVALHTRTAHVSEIVRLTNERHPYEVPCVVAWPIESGNPTYISWIISETREPGSQS